MMMMMLMMMLMMMMMMKKPLGFFPKTFADLEVPGLGSAQVFGSAQVSVLQVFSERTQEVSGRLPERAREVSDN
eukprot:9363575-Karenia_brevis.AAC.1